MYLWLKTLAEAEVREMAEKGTIGKDVKAETHGGSGRKYVDIYEEAMSPDLEINPQLLALAEKLTYRDTIHEGFIPEGIYRRGRAVMTVKTVRNVRSEMHATTIVVDLYQKVFISAPTLRSLRAIYSLARQKKLSPKEKWAEAPSPGTPAEEFPAA